METFKSLMQAIVEIWERRQNFLNDPRILAIAFWLRGPVQTNPNHCSDIRKSNPNSVRDTSKESFGFEKNVLYYNFIQIRKHVLEFQISIMYHQLKSDIKFHICRVSVPIPTCINQHNLFGYLQKYYGFLCSDFVSDIRTVVWIHSPLPFRSKVIWSSVTYKHHI